MQLICDCGHELFVDAETEDVRSDERCPGCGSVGSLKCSHESCHDDACDDCGMDFS